MKKFIVLLGLICLFFTHFSLIVVSTGFSAEKKVVKIAYLGPLSGGNAEVGLAARNAFDLAIKQANASGKFNFEIQTMVLDDEANPSTGVSAALKAVSDSAVVAATGHYNSPVALATIHTFHNAKVPLVVWGTVHPDITNKHNYPEVTRVAATLETQCKMGADFAISKLGYKNWSIIHDTNDFGVASKDIFARLVKSLNGQVLTTDGTSTGTTDFRPILTKIKGMKNSDAIYVGTVSMEGALIKDQMIKLGMTDMIVMGNTGIQSETFNKVAGTAADGTLCTGFSNPHDSEKGKKLVEDYKKAGYRESFNELSAPLAYDATNIILEALKKVGPGDKVALAKEIRSIRYEGVLGETSFNEFGQTRYGGIKIYVSQDGAWKLWENSDYSTGKRKLPKK
jgi:branched-chain amino acid transport system substrate-binding protein